MPNKSLIDAANTLEWADAPLKDLTMETNIACVVHSESDVFELDRLQQR